MRVAVIQVMLKSLGSNGEGDGEIGGKYRGEKSLSGNVLFCKAKAKSLYCQVEGDGGNFNISEMEGGALIVAGPDGFSFDDEYSVGGEDENIFHVTKMRDAACK